MIAVQFDVVIDHAVGAPGHGNDVEDGLNAVEKSFIVPQSMKVLALQMSAGNVYNIILTTFLQL
eukprot:11621036-Ditylum_brightwellii.AAC.1